MAKYTLCAYDKVTGLSRRNALFARAPLTIAYAILIFDDGNGNDVVTTHELPITSDIEKAKRWYRGGVVHTLTEAEAAPIIAAGYSRWLTEIPE